ncbi:MAG: hypothetical protein FWE67_07775 [Planctomycetaceae bacterium]|nr:hypothetical protein [Planctomycetaceae bacterium]
MFCDIAEVFWRLSEIYLHLYQKFLDTSTLFLQLSSELRVARTEPQVSFHYTLLLSSRRSKRLDIPAFFV